jgi:PAS domain S-box-containing protein
MGTSPDKTQHYLDEIKALKAQLRKYEKTRNDVRNGKADALVVPGEQGRQVHTLKGADRPYRVFTEQMSEGAVTLKPDGTILYCNSRFASFLKQPLQQLIGSSIFPALASPGDRQALVPLLACRENEVSKGNVLLKAKDGTTLPISLSVCRMQIDETSTICMVVTDLSGHKWDESLLASERFTRLILELTAEAIIVCDKEGNITRANQKAYALRGNRSPLTRHFGTAFPVSICAQGDDPALFSVARLNEEPMKGPVEALLPLPDGRQAKVLMNAEPMFDEEGTLGGHIITFYDITAIREKEEALRESEERFRTSFESGAVAMTITSVDGNLVRVNPAFCRMLGYSESELAGHRFASITHPDDLSPNLEGVNRIVRGEIPSFRMEKRYICKDGRVIWGDMSTAAVCDARGKPLYLVTHVQDITERKKSEEALRASEQKVKLILNATSEAIWLTDTDGRVQVVNEAALRRINITSEAAIGTICFDHAPPELAAPRRAKMKEAIRTGQPLRFEDEHNGKKFSNAIFPVRDGAMNVSGVAMFSSDITERKKAEEALRESEERFRTAFESGAVAMAMTAFDGKILRVNATLCRMLGYKGSELTKLRFADITYPDDVLPNIEGVQRIARGEIPTFRMEKRYIRKDGRVIWGDMSTAAVRDARGKPLYIVTHIQDITLRKQAEDALRESEERLKFHFENSPLGVVEWDASYIVTQWSSEAEHIFGWKKGEAVGKRIDTLNMIYEEDIPIISRTMERLSSGKERMVVSSNRNYTRTGAVIECVWHNSVLLDENGKMASVMSLVQDITERKKADDALKASEQKYRDLIETANSMILRWTPDGIIRYVNECGLKFFGYTWEEMVGKGVQMTIPARDSVTGADLAALAENIANDPDAYRYSENENIKRNGECAWVIWANKAIRDEQGKLIEILCIGNDITEMKHSKDGISALARQLAEERNKLDLIIQNVQAGIIYFNKEGRIILTNRAAHDLVGYEIPADITIDKKFTMASFSSREGAVYGSLREIPIARQVLRGTAVFDYELFANRKIGKRLLSVNAAPVRDDEGTVVGIIATFRDITELKAAEDVLKRDREMLELLVNERTEELLDAHIQLERARRMADIGRLAATVAHEVRNPLSAIRTAAYNIKRKAKNSLLDKHLATIDKKVLESDHIIQNLLSFTRIRSVSYEQVKIHEVLKDCIGTVAAKYVNWKVELIKSLDCNADDIIEADFTQFKMLVSNMLDNAYQALQDKAGTITIAVHKDRERAWEISIADTGVGMDKTELRKIFEPFYTTKSKGTGLGLAVCREIVEMHGGKIDVQSTKGKGTVFTVNLPVRRKITQPPINPSPGQPQQRLPDQLQ